MIYEKAVDLAFRLAGIALVLVALQHVIGFFDINFLGALPDPLEAFTYLGAVVGALDNAVWFIFKKELAEINVI